MPGIGKGAYGAFLAARYADAQQDPATATVYYNRALQADPGNQNLINESFVAAILAGSPHAATLAPRIPGNALALMLLGNQAAQAGAFGKAAMYYGQLPQDNLAGLIRPLLLAWATMGQGRPQDAIASLAVPMSSGPFAPIYGLNAALIADLAQDNKDAASWYGQFGGQQPSLRLTQILSSWQARQGDVVGAQTMVEQLAQTHPDLTIALPAMLAQVRTPVITSAQNGLAEAYLTLAGSLDQPAQLLLRISFLRFALALRPDLSAARLILASVQAGGEAPANAPPPNPVQL